MDSLLQQLENNEAILLMYLADELPAADRAEVEQMLQSDANLRGELESLRHTQTGFEQTMLAADAEHPLPTSEQVASRQVLRMVNRWISQQLAQEAALKPMVLGSHSRRWWLYPMAVAAMLLLGFILYTGFHQPTTNFVADRNGSSQSDPRLHHRLPDFPGRFVDNTDQESPEDVNVAMASIHDDEPAKAHDDLQMLALVTGSADNETDPFIGTVPNNK